MLFFTYRDAMNEPLLEAQVERDAILRWQDARDGSALELLVRSHARQAWSQAARWTGNPTHMEDLAAEGIIGLMRAADSFDRLQEVRFATYAAWWVMNGIAAALARTKSVIDVPVRTYLAARGGRLPEDERRRVRLATQGTIALDAPLAEGATSASETLMSDELTPEEHVAAASLRSEQARFLRAAMRDLEPREAEIIRRRRLQPDPEPVEQVAADLNMSPDRLRQHEKRAMLRLRRRLIEDGFSPTILA